MSSIIRRALLIPALAMVTACTPHAPPTPSTPTSPRTTPVSATLPKSPDIGRELMGYMVLSDGDRLLSQLSPGLGRDADSTVMKATLLSSLGIDPVIGRLLDLHRNAAVALLNPTLLASSTVQPYILMLPVIPRAQVEQVLSARGAKLERTPWGFVLPSNLGRVYVAFTGNDYAVVAWRQDLLQAAATMLGPKLAERADAPIRVHVSVENLYTAFGPQLSVMLTQFARMSEGGGPAGDPQVAFAMRGLRNVSRYVDSVKDIELLANLDSAGLTLTARLDGKADGAWAGYVQQQKPGPAWGVQFLPADSVLVYTTHASPLGRAEDIEASVDYLADASPAKKGVGEGERNRFRKALTRAASSTQGELAYAVWPARHGGVGLGGAYRVTDPASARAAVGGAYSEVAAHLGGLIARSLTLDPERFAKRIVTRKSTTRIGGVETDLLEVSVKWPQGAEVEKRVFESLFGPKMVLATAFVGEQALFAIGPDHAERLATMIGAANGRPAASLGDEPGFAEALNYRAQSRVSMSYLETSRMARFAAGLMVRSSDLDDRERTAIASVMAQVGNGAIVSTTNAQGARFEVTTHVPNSAMMGVAQLNGALWRIALSPLVNPPMMPPLPVPPLHVTPPVSSGDSAAGPSL